MTGKEKLQSALHRNNGTLPMDFGGTPVSGMHITCVEQLRYHYGLEPRPVKAWEPYQMLGWLDEDLLDAMGVDVTPIQPPSTMFGFSSSNWKEWKTPWGQNVLIGGAFQTAPAPDGGIWVFPGGDRTVPPSAHMPVGGYFFDTIIRQEPMDIEGELDSSANLEEFAPLSDGVIAHYQNEIERVGTSSRGVIAILPGMALGDIALVPAPFMKHPRGIRDISDWYMATITRQDYIHEVFSKQCDIALGNLERLRTVLGTVVDAVFICGTDFGTQTSQFCSPKTFEELYAPYYKKMNAWIHAHTTWKTFKHSCGAVYPLIPALIDSGFDILNPVQCSATGMEPQRLKEEFGDRLVFWGAGVDTQKTLPFGSPEEVRSEVLERCNIFSQGGGFVFNAIHNVQAKTPLVNIVSMLDAVNEFRK